MIRTQTQTSIIDAFIALFKFLPKEIQEDIRKKLYPDLSKKTTMPLPAESHFKKKGKIEILKKDFLMDKKKGKVEILKNNFLMDKVSKFRKYLLSWPEMSESEFNYIQEKRKHFNQWK